MYSPIAPLRDVSGDISRTTGPGSPAWNASTACAQARAVSAVIVSAGAGGGAPQAGIAAQSVAIASGTIAASRIARRVKTMRWSAVRLAKIASSHSAGSRRSSSAPAIRQIIRSGRSIIPTLHSTPMDSARAFV